MSFLDKMKKSLSQGSEIQAICQRLGLTPAQLADRVPMKTETMRKVVRGYQAASERTMQQIRNVERMITLVQGQSVTEPVAGPSPYGIMKLETLQRNFVEVAEQLERAEPPARGNVLGNLKAMLAELERRERVATPAPPGRLTEAQSIALQASETLDRPPAPAAGAPPANVPLPESEPPAGEPAD